MRAALVLLLLLLAGAASARVLTGPIMNANGPTFPGGSEMGLTGSVSGINGGGIPLTPCNAGQLDFSDATGCNLTLYMVMLR